jgi:hypothetical protein
MTDPELIKADIEATRAELAETADALAAKLDVKAQANYKLREAGERVAANIKRVRSAAPEPVQKAIDKAEQAARPALAKAGEDKKRTTMIAAGTVLALLVVRRVRRGRATGASPPGLSG